jgi:hypothetical protein
MDSSSALSHLPTLVAEHGYLLASTTAIAFYGVFAGGFFVGGARGKAFGKEWVKTPAAEKLIEEHKKALGDASKDDKGGVPKFSASGYPDMGSGRYSATLPYKAWFEFNNAQRVHYNLVENLPSILALHLVAGVYFPRAAAAAAVPWLVARHIWGMNYVSAGPEGRYNGIAALHQLCLISWFGMAVAGSLKAAGLITTSAF